jgi:glycosyltransferase involved in cell wall biosynthesis
LKQLGVRMVNIDFYPLLGGAQMHTLRLCKYLISKGVNVEVITRHHPGLAYQEKIDGISVYRTPIFGKSKASFSLSFIYNALKRLAATRNQFQIIHSHEMLSPMTIGLLSSELLHSQLVINPHRGGYLGDMYKLKKTRRQTGEIRLAWARKSGDAFISVSKEISSELISGGIDPNKIRFLPYVIDTDHFYLPEPDCKIERQNQLKLPEGIRVCYTGRLVAEKGLDGLLRAWSAVIQEQPSARLMIVGDGDQRKALEAQAAVLGINGSVQFTGAVPDTMPYLQASDIYIQPSFTEGLPISMLEAMSCGLPILATAVGGVSDLLRDHQNGIIIQPHDEEAIRLRLLELISNPGLRRALGDLARKNVIDYCGIEKIGQAHLDLYYELAGMAA